MSRRCIGIDVHRDECEIAIWEAGEVRRAGRVRSRVEALEQFAAEVLQPSDEVALEATTGAGRVAAIIEPHVARVVVANTHRLAAISQSKKKTDREDAKILAQLLAAGMIDGAWVPDEQIRALRRRVGRRHGLVVARTRAKNEVTAALGRNLHQRPPMSDVFTERGRRWLGALDLPDDEVETMSAALRQIDFFTAEIETIERELARYGTGSPQVRRLMTVPGVAMVSAVTFISQVGEIGRFPSPRHLVGYLGLDPRVRQSGEGDARTGRISKEGAALVRHVMVEAATAAIRTPGPLRAFYRRLRAKKGHQIAVVATARKMVTIFWHLLSRGEDYRHRVELPTTKKLRKMELKAGAAPRRGGDGKRRGSTREQRHAAEIARLEQVEADYRALVAGRAKAAPGVSRTEGT